MQPATPAASPVRTAEEMLLNFDGWLGNQTPEIRRGIDFHLKASGPSADAEKKRLSSMYAVSEETGLDLATINERWMEIRGGYAEKQGGDWLAAKDDEDLFHGRLVQHVQKRKDERFLLQGPDGTAEDEAGSAARLSSLAGVVSAAALRGEPYTGAWSAWQQGATGKPGYDAARLTDYEAAARRIHSDMSARVAAVKPAVDSMLAGLMGERDGTAGAYGGKDLVDQMAALPPDQRGLAQAMLATRAAAEGANKEAGWQMMEAIGRGSAGLLTGTARTFEAGTLAEADKKLAAMKPGDEIGGRFENLYQFARGESADSTEARALGYALEPLLPNKKVTQEDIDAARARVAQERDRLQIQIGLEQTGKAALDPIKGANFFTSRIAYPFAESILPQVGLALLTRQIAPVGAGITGALASSAGASVPMWGMMADQNAQQLMQQSPGMDIAQAYDIGRKTAVAQTGLEYAQLTLGMGTLPKLGAVLTSMKAATWKTAGKALAVGLVGQNALEGAQDIMPPIAQALASDAPGVDWETVLNGHAPEVSVRTEGAGPEARNIYTAAGQDFDTPEAAQAHARENKVGGYWSERIDTALALLPMVILGTGGKVMQAKTGAATLQRVAADMTDTKLHAAGIPEATRAAILAETDAAKRLDAFSAALENADRATAAEGAQRMQAEARAQESAFSGAMDAAGVTFERGTRDGVPVYRVTRGDTTSEHATAGDALATVQDHLSIQDRETSGPLLEMIEALDRNPLSPVQESSVTLSPRESVADYQATRAAAMQDAGATPEAQSRAERESAAMTRRQQVYEEANPDAPIDWRAVNVGGQSELETKVGVARAVIRIANGESAYTPLEEHTEAEAEAWVRSGETSWQDLAGMIREIEAATGDKYLNGHTNGKDAAQDQLATKEAYSELSQVHATGKGRAGKAATGAVAEVARMDRMAARQTLRQAIAGGQVRESLVARLKAHTEWLKAVIGKAIRLHRARREAGGAFALDDFLNKSIGIEPEAQHAAAVVQEAQRIYTPPTPEQEADGIAFALKPTPGQAAMIERLDNVQENRAILGDRLKALIPSVSQIGTTDTARAWIREKLERIENQIRSGSVRSVDFAPMVPTEYIRKVEIDPEQRQRISEALEPVRAALEFKAADSLDGNEWRDIERRTLYGTLSESLIVSYRLTPVATLDKLAADLERRSRDPEARRIIFDRMKGALDTLRRNWTETRRTWNGESQPKVDKRTPKELNKEQAFREAAAMADAEEAIWNTLSSEAQQALGMTSEDVSAYGGPLAQRFSGGRFGTAGRIQSRAESLRNADAGDFSLGGEYDGAAGLPSLFFGGAITPDNAAQEAYEAGEISDPSPDALWDALRSELLTQSRNRSAMQGAMDGIKAAQKQARRAAKQEAADWRAEQDAQQAKDWDSRAVMLRHLRTLDAILSALPPEVRAKVGGWTAVASLKTQPAMLKELELRLQLADEHLETALRKDALTSIAALIEKASPKREGGKKPKGKLGAETHRFFDDVERVAAYTPEELTAKRAELETALAAAGSTTAAADIFEKQQVLDTFGALGKVDTHTAAHLTRALDLLETVYATGRNRWRMLEESRLEEVAGFARLTTSTLGGISTQAILENKDTANKMVDMLKLGTLSLKSFTEVLETLLGRGHVLAIRWAQAAREGMAARTDEVLATGHDWAAQLRKATGKSDLAARKAAWDMGTVRNVKVTKAPSGTAETMVPVNTIDQWTEGTADPAALGFSKAEAAELQAARAAMLEDNLKVEEAGKGRQDMRDFLPLIRQTGGKVEAVDLTEAEGVYLSMLWAQEAYKPALRKAGFGDDAQAEIEAGLSDAAKQLRGWLATRYEEGYAPLARQFRNMFGVDLPQVDNYAPGLFYNQGTGETTLDVSGSGHVEGGFRSGFLKDRTAHTAEPRVENAFHAFFGHANQTAHWKALAPLTRELRGVFGNPEVKQAILSKHGPDMLSAVSKWIESIEGNGLKVAHSKLGQMMFSMQAHVALAWKIGTIAKQSTALLGAAYRMPSSDYLQGLGMLMRGKLDTSTIWNSALIQRRLKGGFSPEVRAALAGSFTGKPSRRADFLNKGMELIGFADAFFTAGSAAIAYDYHLRQALAAGMPQEAASAAAMRETADIVARTAQPVEVNDRSLFEQSLGGFGKGIFVFSSEARQKSSMWLTAWGNTFTGKATAEDYRVLVISHLIVGPMIQTITAIMRDRREDDDEWDNEKGVLGFLDPEHWNPMDWLIAAGTGPPSGIPVLRDVVDGFSGESGPLARFPLAIKAAAKMFEGPPESDAERVEWYGRQLTTMLQGLDSFTAVAAGLASDAMRTADNLHDDPEEAQPKEIRRLEKQIKERRDAAEQERREAMTPEQRKEEDDQEAEQKATRAAQKLERMRNQAGG